MEIGQTPYYEYDLKVLRETLDAAIFHANGKFKIHYALKANNQPKILNEIVQKKIGADCVSGNEVSYALQHGFNPNDIVLAGVGKTDNEIYLALKNNIFSLNVESIPELLVINELALKLNKNASVALRLNPNIDAKTHQYITTGIDENKFGISEHDLSFIFQILPQLSNITVTGIHFHIGSQITSMDRFLLLSQKVAEWINVFQQNLIRISHINLGGGLGVDYHFPLKNTIPDFDAYFAQFRNLINMFPNISFHVELGRSLVAQCGRLVSTVLYIKESRNKKFCIVDAGMTELIRPALYRAHHEIIVVSTVLNEFETYDVVGPVCESSDVFLTDYTMPKVKRGDKIAILTAGAYGEVMQSNYNLRKLNTPVFINSKSNL